MNAGADPDREVSLPAERSFVIQFRAGSGTRPDGPWAGRVEHVVSGRASRFADCRALCEFIVQVLTGCGPERPSGDARGHHIGQGGDRP